MDMDEDSQKTLDVNFELFGPAVKTPQPHDSDDSDNDNMTTMKPEPIPKPDSWPDPPPTIINTFYVLPTSISLGMFISTLSGFLLCFLDFRNPKSLIGKVQKKLLKKNSDANSPVPKSKPVPLKSKGDSEVTQSSEKGAAEPEGTS